MKQISRLLFSNKLTLLALLAFAISMAVATFMENDFGTPVARKAVYDAWWFELLMVLIAINFIGNIFRYKLLRKEKLSILSFHLAFIVIISGAFVTRYTGYEGLMRIREGSSSNLVISQKRYLNIDLDWEKGNWSKDEEAFYTQLHLPEINEQISIEGEALNLTIDRFVPNAVQVLKESEEGNEVLEIVSVVGGERKSIYLPTGSAQYINGHEFSFNREGESDVSIKGTEGNYTIRSKEALNYMVMATQVVGNVTADSTDSLRMRSLYQSEHFNFVLSQYHPKSKVDFEIAEDDRQAKNAADLLFVNMEYKGEKKEIILAALDGVYNPSQNHKIGNVDIEISYGPRLIEIPFELYLRDFQLERYPGSVSPSSYASELTLIEDGKSEDIRISMNNVLDHGGLRFFQASYDLDEMGTVLSVNQDFWGTQITYLGYFLMSLGMLLTLFGKNSRFQLINQKLKKLSTSAVPPLALAILMITASGFTPIPKEQASEFGRLMVQDMDGRIKPLNTLSSEFLRKISRKTHFELEEEGKSFPMNSDQLFLSVHQDPFYWKDIPILKVDQKKAFNVLNQLGLEGKDYLSFQELIHEDGNYKLEMAVEAAQRRKPAERSEQDNEIIKLDERFNIMFQALSGDFLKIFPQSRSENNSWYDPNFVNAGFSEEDSAFVRNVMKVYYQEIQKSNESGDWSEVDNYMGYIRTFQNSMGKKVFPSEGRIKAELWYNQWAIFNRLFPFYWLMGIFLIVLAIIKVFSHHKSLNILYKIGVGITFILFLLQTINMIVRWYAADYPPWSNGYEMIILVSWALLLFGFIFNRRSEFILPLASLFTGTLLFVSYLDWLSPEITNLVPVLKSYWLKIHVAIIVSSYAPLALSALLGILSLFFILSQNEKFKTSLKELTYINELSMTIGLFMLSIGTFLGGVWANESWGRYWGWDPKETWALISIMIYAVVLHMRFIPALRSKYAFNLASVIAFFSIIMTSFGVNYYLSGLHSYAAGDPLPIPTFVYWVVGSLALLATLAYTQKKKRKIIN